MNHASAHSVESALKGGATLDWNSLDATDQRWFAGHVPAALSRRDAGYFSMLRWRWIDWILTGAIGLVGLSLFGWSALEAALLLLITHWLGWMVDLVQWCLRRPALRVADAQDCDDTRFWQFVAMLRGQRKCPPEARSAPPMLLSLIVDLVAGAAATVLALQGLQRAGPDPLQALASSGVLIGVGLIVVFGSVPSLRARLVRRADGSVALPMFRVGQRGIGLLVLVFGLMAAGGGSLAGSWLMGCAYGFFLLMGAIELIWGVPAQRAETAWLRAERERATPAAPG